MSPCSDGSRGTHVRPWTSLDRAILPEDAPVTASAQAGPAEPSHGGAARRRSHHAEDATRWRPMSAAPAPGATARSAAMSLRRRVTAPLDLRAVGSARGWITAQQGLGVTGSRFPLPPPRLDMARQRHGAIGAQQGPPGPFGAPSRRGGTARAIAHSRARSSSSTTEPDLTRWVAPPPLAWAASLSRGVSAAMPLPRSLSRERLTRGLRRRLEPPPGEGGGYPTRTRTWNVCTKNRCVANYTMG